jgi:hypothetical protein
LRSGNGWDELRGSILTTLQFGLPAYLLSGAAGALYSRTVSLAPPVVRLPLRLALWSTFVGGAGGSFIFMMGSMDPQCDEDDMGDERCVIVE